jgi:mRNA interferase HigB
MAFLMLVQYTQLVYIAAMHVITKQALVEFWAKHADAQAPLQAWYRIMESAVFKDFNALKSVFGNADYVDGLTVFDIGGNKYRLIAAIHYNRRKVYIRAVLTHRQYDRDNWKRGK